MVTNPQEPQDNQEIPEAEEENAEETKATYESLVTLEPERPIDMSKFNPPKTIDEEEEDVGTLSDFKAALRAITPRFKDAKLDEMLQPVMKGRTFPDNFIDKLFLISASRIEDMLDDPNVDPVSTLVQTQSALEISYEGRHIVDVSDLYGVTREQDLDKLANTLGLG